MSSLCLNSQHLNKCLTSDLFTGTDVSKHEKIVKFKNSTTPSSAFQRKGVRKSDTWDKKKREAQGGKS